MRKPFWIPLAFALVLIFTSCPNNITRSRFLGLLNLVVEPGTAPGELLFSFDATTPPAESYTLYLYEGTTTSAVRVMAHYCTTESGPVHPRAPGDPATLHLAPGETFSIVVVARSPGFDDLVSHVVQVTTPALPPGTMMWQGGDRLDISGNNPGELVFSFGAVYPAAETFTLYFIGGERNSADEIMAGGTGRSITGDLAGVIDGLAFGMYYSFVVVARRPDYADLISRIVRVRVPAGRMAGLSDLVIMQGTEPGDPVRFSFSATTPTADSYFLYFMATADATAVAIIGNGMRYTVVPHTAESPGLITGLTASTNFSIVVVARKAGFEALVSAVKRITTPAPPAGTLTGLAGLNVAPGAGPDVLTFSFSATVPAAESYTLYYIARTGATADAVIAGGNYRTLPGTSGTLTGFAHNTTFSFVVVARRYGYSDHRSGVVTATTPVFTWLDDGLTITAGANPGTLNFSFSASATSISADSFTLYFVPRQETSVNAIMAGQRRTLTANSGIIDGLTPGTYHSIVVVARRQGFSDLVSIVGQARTPIGIMTGLNDLVIIQGSEPGDLAQFSFSATTPPADAYYLYFINVAGATAVEIIDSGSWISVVPHTAESPGLIPGLTASTSFSIVVVARKAGFDDLVSAVESITTPAPPAETLTGLGDLSVTPGDSPGELTFSFSETVPVAESYTLYYIAGTEADIDAIIAGGNYRILPGTYGTLTGFTHGTYSVVVVARRPGYSDLRSAIVSVATPTFTWPGNLTVTAGANPGTLNFDFPAASLAADSYTLYYIQGQETDADVIRTVAVEGTVITDNPGVITGLTFGNYYSVMVVAYRAGFEELVATGQARTSLNTMTGLTGFAVSQGTTPGTLSFVFDAVYPAGASYTLYYVPRFETDVSTIRAGASRTIDTTAGVIDGLEFGMYHSVVVVARKEGFNDLVSVVRQVRTSATELTRLTLTVNQGADSVTMIRGGVLQTFTVALEPPSANPNLAWSIYPADVAGVMFSPSGLTATLQVAATVNPGTFTVIATDANTGLYDTATANVVFAAATGVTVTPGSVILTRNSTQQLNARVEPYPAANQNVTWTCDRNCGPTNNTVTINASNQVVVNNSAVRNATWTVTARTDNNLTASMTVHVLYSIPTGINVATHSIDVPVRHEVPVVNLAALFGAQVTPANAANGVLEWEIIGGSSPHFSMVGGGWLQVAADALATNLLVRVSVLGVESITPVDLNVNITRQALTCPDCDAMTDCSHTFGSLMVRRGGINPYGMHLGAINHRGLVYSFNATGDFSANYILYFIRGNVTERATIRANGTSVPVRPRTSGEQGFIGGVSRFNIEYGIDLRDNATYLRSFSYDINAGTPVFDIDDTYSVVVVAQRTGHEDMFSDVVQINPVLNNALTISDVAAHVRVAVLLTGRGMLQMAGAAGRVPLAVAYRLPGTRTFVFYQVSNGVYDPTSPLTGNTGNTRHVALSDTERQPVTLTDGSSDGHYRFLTGTGMLSPALHTIVHRMSLTMSQFFRQ